MSWCCFSADAAWARRERWLWRQSSRVLSSRWLHRGWPAMRLCLAARGPGIERVIDDEAVLQHFVVVRRQVSQAHGDREQPSGLRGEVMAVGVGAAHDFGDCNDGGIAGQIVSGDECVKAAALADMREFHARHIIGRRTRFLGNMDNLIGRNEDELRLLVDKACNQPGAGNTINDRTFAGNPFHHTILSSTVTKGIVGAPIACQAAIPPERPFASTPRRRSSATASPLTWKP